MESSVIFCSRGEWWRGEVKHRSSVEHGSTGSLTLYLGNMWGVMGEGDTSIGCG